MASAVGGTWSGGRLPAQQPDATINVPHPGLPCRPPGGPRGGRRSSSS